MAEDNGSGSIVRRAPGPLAAPDARDGFDGVVGSPITYTPAPYLGEAGWGIVPQSARDWAINAAGAPISDPVTGAHQVYWYCDITPDERPSPAGTKAEFDMFLFGRRGLAVCRGTTDSFVASPAGSRWRQTRFDLPIDSTRIRNDHRRAALANTAETMTAPDSEGTAAGPGGGLLPEGLLSNFGNLPVVTQKFLVEPFAISNKRPQQAVLHAMNETRGGRLVESVWTYLFNARWLSFAFLQRSVAVTTQHETNEEPGSASRDARQLTRAPWDLAAWVAPVMKSPASAAPGLGARRPGEIQ